MGLQRQARLQKILNGIKACWIDKKITSKERLLAEMMMEWGTARRTNLEFLQTLKMLDKILIEGDDIWPAPKEQPQKPTAG